jgi:hypothetical protein
MDFTNTPFGKKDSSSSQSPKLNTRMSNDNNAFMNSVEQYVKKNTPHLVILTPCYGSVCYVNFVHCLMDTLNLFRQLNIPTTVEFCKNDSLVSRARNNLIAKAMYNPKTTHILFIDNDITWNPHDILKLMLADKQLCGGVYPLKKYNWDKLLESPTAVSDIIQRKNASVIKNSITDEQMIQHNLLKYNVNFLENVLSIDNNMAKVKHIATGFMMIKRSTIEQMTKAYPYTKYTDDVGFLKAEENLWAYALFDCGVEEGHYFSEDWLFCHRWTKMGGTVYLDVSINLKHTGTEDFNGSFIASVI